MWLLLLLLPALATAFEIKNSALVFLKPHAATDSCEKFVREHLSAAGVSIVGAGVKKAAEIEKAKLIDQHYGSLAKIAMDLQPAELSLSDSAKDTFASTFGVEWSDATASMLRNDEAMAKLNVDGIALEPMWRSGTQCKLAPGTYVSKLDGTSEPVYTLNGFYPAMRQSFVEDGAEVRYLVCEFDESELTWQNFRREVIGATNPSEAAKGSCRGKLLAKWEALGLESAPTYGQNGVHASAGPLEGLKERIVWAGGSLETDEFAQALVGGGVDKATLEAWLEANPVVTLGGETDKVFDLTEEMGSKAVLDLCRVKKETKAAAEKKPAVEIGPPPVGFEWGAVF